MDLRLDEDQESLREAFGELFEKESSPARVRAAEPLGHDDALWRVVATSGVPLMAVAEEYGGGGADLSALVVVLREAGRRLAPAPVAESAVAARLLARFDDGRELLAGVADGAVLPVVAPQPAAGGRWPLVPAGAVADTVVGMVGDELLLVRRAPGAMSPAPANLGSSPLADVEVTGGTVLASGAAAAAAHATAMTEWKLLLAAALDGLREEALRIGVDYVKERHAFGVPLGWFQSVQHRLADVATAGEGAELLVHRAAWALDRGLDRGPALASMAVLFTAEAAFRTCRESLQFHGGYGYTLEYDIQLYFRRAKSWPLALGSPRREYRALAAALFTDHDGNAA